MYVPFIALEPLWVSRHQMSGGWQCSGCVLAHHASASPHPHAHLHTNPHKHIYTMSLFLSNFLFMCLIFDIPWHTHTTQMARGARGATWLCPGAGVFGNVYFGRLLLSPLQVSVDVCTCALIWMNTHSSAWHDTRFTCKCSASLANVVVSCHLTRASHANVAWYLSCTMYTHSHPWFNIKDVNKCTRSIHVHWESHL